MLLGQIVCNIVPLVATIKNRRDRIVVFKLGLGDLKARQLSITRVYLVASVLSRISVLVGDLTQGVLGRLSIV